MTAALWGVFVHAAAGKQLSNRIGTVGFLAREIPYKAPGILDRLSRKGLNPSSCGRGVGVRVRLLGLVKIEVFYVVLFAMHDARGRHV
ncbi:hypothetical protein ADT25_07320 [Xanthomonas oryzae]|uniref:YjeF C-terminal domain-containing protein n=1 Tax=Xanthomonas oryzae TaxID=347 RepID=A0AAP0ZMT7_9XANT|nr:hypothetical protein ADT25_07320 [Xanthomonas oryzae]